MLSVRACGALCVRAREHVCACPACTRTRARAATPTVQRGAGGGGPQGTIGAAVDAARRPPVRPAQILVHAPPAVPPGARRPGGDDPPPDAGGGGVIGGHGGVVGPAWEEWVSLAGADAGSDRGGGGAGPLPVLEMRGPVGPDECAGEAAAGTASLWAAAVAEQGREPRFDARWTLRQARAAPRTRPRVNTFTRATHERRRTCAITKARNGL
jgi:hypothetical protein